MPDTLELIVKLPLEGQLAAVTDGVVVVIEAGHWA